MDEININFYSEKPKIWKFDKQLYEDNALFSDENTIYSGHAPTFNNSKIIDSILRYYQPYYKYFFKFTQVKNIHFDQSIIVKATLIFPFFFF